MTGQTAGHADARAAEKAGDAQSQPPLQATSVIAASMHREQMTDARPAGSPGAVHGHSEFVTVRQGDAVPSKDIGEPRRESRRERAIEAIQLDLHTGAAQLTREPSFSVGRNDDDVVASGGLHIASDAGQP